MESYRLQENIRRCVCIIYDPSRSNQGVLALKALKLSDSFMELYRTNNFNGEKYVLHFFMPSSSDVPMFVSNDCFILRLREKNLSWVDIFEEIPVSFCILIYV